MILLRFLFFALFILLLGCGQPRDEIDDSPTMVEGDHTHYHVHGAEIAHDHTHDETKSTAHTHEHTHHRDFEKSEPE